MSNNKNWKSDLQTILDEHNFRHGTRKKGVSHNTASARAHGLFRCFTLLRRLGIDPRPANLKGRHIQLLVDYWTCNAGIAELCRQRAVPIPTKPYSAAYIQQQLSFLRVYSTWIGKPGLVLPPDRYVNDAALVSRTYIAQADKSWSGNDVDAAQVIARVASIDERVAAQLDLLLNFGLRRKEAIMFFPHAAIVPAHAIPAHHPVADQYVAFLRIKRGTKGGRLRFTAVRNDAQHRALERARAFAAYPTSHMGHPGLELKQSLKRFENVVHQAGITKKQCGVTPHGLRHQFAGDLFFDIAELQAPVRGGDPTGDPEVLKAAYLEVARQLGHNRASISGAYLGARTGIKKPDDQTALQMGGA